MFTIDEGYDPSTMADTDEKAQKKKMCLNDFLHLGVTGTRVLAFLLQADKPKNWRNVL